MTSLCVSIPPLDDSLCVDSRAYPFEHKGSQNGVLLVHGLTASPTEMRPLGEALASEDYSVLGVRLPGHGTTPRELGKLKWQQWLAHVVEKARVFSEKLESLFIAGLSTGCMLALLASMSADLRSKVRGCILITPAFQLQTKLRHFMGFLKHVVRYRAKDEGTRHFFEEHGLFSYLEYPTAAIHQLVKLQKKVNSRLTDFEVPILGALAEMDDMVDNEVASAKLSVIATHGTNVKTIVLPESGHIATVGPGAEFLFHRIKHWLVDILSET